MILVTGGAGFIGSHIAELFLNRGDPVGIVDDLRMGVNNTPILAHRWGQDVADTHMYMSGLDQATAIVHCAARADVQFNWTAETERRRMWRENIETTIALLEAAPKVPFVVLSTCAVYGDSSIADGHERDACIATSPYAASKLACEAIVQAYCEHRRVPWYEFRLGCVVGSRYHHGHIAEFVERYRKDGKLIARSSGPAKSFVHVLDVAGAVAHVIDHGTPSGIYNLHGGLWSARATVRAMGIEAEWPDNAHGWSGDTVPIVNSDKIRAEGFSPGRSVEQGVREALETLGWVK